MAADLIYLTNRRLGIKRQIIDIAGTLGRLFCRRNCRDFSLIFFSISAEIILVFLAQSRRRNQRSQTD